MASQLFVNLPVKDLDKSVEFFTKLGFTFNPQFTDETATCMIVSENIMFMLLTHPKFEGFAPNGIADTSKGNECLLALSQDSREAVDEIVAKALEAGGTTTGNTSDHGFMYESDFIDLDGHCWGIFWMDPAHVQ